MTQYLCECGEAFVQQPIYGRLPKCPECGNKNVTVREV